MDTRGLPTLNRQRTLLGGLCHGPQEWHRIAEWINATLPIFMAYFPEYLEDFRKITERPKPLDFPVRMTFKTDVDERNKREADKKKEEVNGENNRKKCVEIASFIDGIVTVAVEQRSQDEIAANAVARKAQEEKRAAKQKTVAPDAPTNEQPTEPAMSHKIFISHASKDKDAVDKLVDFLQVTHEIPSKDIFCSSIEGLGIPNGENFVDYIKGKLVGCKIVVFVLSDSFFKSEFCLAEMGAMWVLATAHRTFLLIPPAGIERMRGIIGNIQADAINTASGITDFCEVVRDKLGITINRMARWEAKKTEFLEVVNALIAKQPKSTDVTPAEIEQLKANYTDAQREIVGNLETIKQLEATVEALKTMQQQGDDNLPEVINH